MRAGAGEETKSRSRSSSFFPSMPFFTEPVQGLLVFCVLTAAFLWVHWGAEQKEEKEEEEKEEENEEQEELMREDMDEPAGEQEEDEEAKYSCVII